MHLIEEGGKVTFCGKKIPHKVGRMERAKPEEFVSGPICEYCMASECEGFARQSTKLKEQGSTPVEAT